MTRRSRWPSRDRASRSSWPASPGWRSRGSPARAGPRADLRGGPGGLAFPPAVGWADPDVGPSAPAQPWPGPLRCRRGSSGRVSRPRHAAARLPRPAQALRSAQRGRRGQLPHRPRRDVRPPRAQRRRQDDHHLDGLRPPAAGRRERLGSRSCHGHRRDRGQVAHRLRAPGPGHLPGPHGPREPPLLRTPAAPLRGGPGRRA